MSETYRLATTEDAEELLELILSAYQSIRELGIEFIAARADLQQVRENITENNCYVLEIDGQISATISLKYLKDVTAYPFLYWFAVSPKLQARGIGNRLLHYVEQTVVRDTLLASAVTLATSRKHPWLLSYYERKGYYPFLEKELGQDDKLVFLTKPLRGERKSEWNAGSARKDEVEA
ncbi:GNAT family N-acetyltransferase [Paenibacillus sp. FJAT-26967]|uniref:GNAT family N-acetyltransferase n=1 Tax=Paenibacillus sp. FJAT-26967 TaxID=1729690 RepID=UPI000838B809|nr:GNAT family N-acetyltransferase [Paenibacillus sp. FJAT-26967]